MRSLIVLTVASFSLAACVTPPPAVVCVKPTDIPVETQKRWAEERRQCKASGKTTTACEIIDYYDLDRRKMRATCQ